MEDSEEDVGVSGAGDDWESECFFNLESPGVTKMSLSGRNLVKSTEVGPRRGRIRYIECIDATSYAIHLYISLLRKEPRKLSFFGPDLILYRRNRWSRYPRKDSLYAIYYASPIFKHIRRFFGLPLLGS